MTCECSEKMKMLLKSKRSTARSHDAALKKQLDIFQEGIMNGAEVLACVHLFRAGVYLAAIEPPNLEPDNTKIFHELTTRLRQEDQPLYQFAISHKKEIEAEDNSTDKPKMLRGILRQKKRAEGLLEGRAIIEIGNARKALERAKKTGERLHTWKEGIRKGTQPRLDPISDIHGITHIDQGSE